MQGKAMLMLEQNVKTSLWFFFKSLILHISLRKLLPQVSPTD